MRPLVYIMTPILILTIILASRFVTWNAIKGETPQARADMQNGTVALRNWELRYAIAAFTRAIEIEPEYAEAYMKRGLAYYRSGRYNAAIEDYTRALNLNRYHADAYTSRGDAHRGLGDLQQALGDYSAALKKRWNARVIQKRAQTHLKRGDFQKAFADYNTLIQRQPNVLAYYARGNAYLQAAAQGDENHLKSALADLNRTLTLEARFAGGYICRAQIHALLGEHAAAAGDYKHAAKLFTETLEAWQGELQTRAQFHFWRALAYQKLGEIDKAAVAVTETYSSLFRFFLKKLRNCGIL